MDGVVRVQRELKGSSNAALMATSTDFGSAHNRVLSADTLLQLLPNWILTGQAMTSDTSFLDGRHLNGPAWYLDWAHSGKHFVSETSYIDRSPSFVADLGFINRVDIRDLHQTLGYKWRPEGSAIQSFGPLVAARINYDHLGRLQDWSVNPGIAIELPRMTQVAAGWWEGFELYANQGFRKYHSEVEASSEWKKWLAFSAAWAKGTGIDYYPVVGMRPFLGDSTDASAGFTLRPTVRTRIDETYIYSGLKTTGGVAVFDNHIARSKINYQFTRAASLRFILDYNSVLPNESLISFDKSKHIGIDALFTYMVNPGTALYVGYTDLYDNWRLYPGVSPELRRTIFPDLNTGRQFFVKLNYLFRF